MFLALRPLRWRSWTADPFTPGARHRNRYLRQRSIRQSAPIRLGRTFPGRRCSGPKGYSIDLIYRRVSLTGKSARIEVAPIV
jgi:hypothetical protein